MLCNYIWCWWSVHAEKTHPMTAGAYCVRKRHDRRPGSAPISLLKFCAQEGWRHMRYLGYFLAAFFIFQHVTFETEFALAIKERGKELTGRLRGLGDWFKRTFGKVMTRQWLNEFWKRYGRQRWHLLLNPWGWRWHLKMVPFIITEIVYTFRFGIMFLVNARNMVSRSS